MANSSHLPPGNLHELRPGFPSGNGNTKIRAVSAAATSASSHVTSAPAIQEDPAAGNQLGPRKLVRPKLPPGAASKRSFPSSRGESPVLTHQAAARMNGHDDHSAPNAESFYFQKQVQTQTLMVFVLEDGEHLEGYIEWYDRDAIKIRNGRRTLIYKSAIKYLYKAGEFQNQHQETRGNSSK